MVVYLIECPPERVSVKMCKYHTHMTFFHHQIRPAGYNVTIDENTPVGLTIFRGIQAVDRDRPNSPNSDIAYSIVAGNEDRKFSLEAGGQKAVVVLRKPLDLEAGDALFNMTILAQVCG